MLIKQKKVRKEFVWDDLFFSLEVNKKFLMMIYKQGEKDWQDSQQKC